MNLDRKLIYIVYLTSAMSIAAGPIISYDCINFGKRAKNILKVLVCLPAPEAHKANLRNFIYSIALFDKYILSPHGNIHVLHFVRYNIYHYVTLDKEINNCMESFYKQLILVQVMKF